jgi:membrane protein
MLGRTWQYLQAIVEAFVADDALSRGASISFYTVTSIGPVLFIVVAIAGMVFGEDAARGAVSEQLSDLMGRETADMVQRAIQSASGKSTGIVGSVIGIFTLIITRLRGVRRDPVRPERHLEGAAAGQHDIATGPSSRAKSWTGRSARLFVAGLVVSALLAALASYINARLPFSALVLELLNFVISFALMSVLFGAVYKVLPDVELAWRDVLFGAIVTALLFNLGKFLIGLYLAHSAVASSYGAAGAVIVVLMWIYYSAQIFLLGAEFTKIHASRRGTPAAANALAGMPEERG